MEFESKIGKSDREGLELLIPSETVREYVRETGWTFTDLQKAALLCHRGLLQKDEHAHLKALGEQTADCALKGQITEYLGGMERGFQAFKENSSKRHIYILKAQEEGGFWDSRYIVCGYFFDWEMAFEHGRKEKAPFEIGKYLVNGAGESEDGGCCHYPVAWARFDRDGEMLLIECREIPYSEIDNKHFTEIYFEVPNPFERGDIVKNDLGTYGIVDTTQEQWKEHVARLEGISCSDYSDILIGVLWFNEEEGTFDLGEGINPLGLELYQPMDIHEESCSLMDRLLACASLVDQGKGSMDDLYSLTMDYRKALERADKRKIAETAILKALGRGHWLAVDEVYEQVKDSCDWSTFVSRINRLIEHGRVQSAALCGKDKEYICGLDAG